jgi:hypothetical protein
MNLFKKKKCEEETETKEKVRKLQLRITYNSGRTDSFQHPYDENGLIPSEFKGLVHWWMNPYFPNKQLRLAFQFNFSEGFLLLNRSEIESIKLNVFKLEEEI